MNRTDGQEAWERLLGEPVACTATVRILGSPVSRAMSRRRVTAILTPSRFLLVGRSSILKPPKTPDRLRELIRFDFPRTDITGISPLNDGRRSYLFRYYDGDEKKIVLQPGNDGLVLLNMMEQDIDRG